MIQKNRLEYKKTNVYLFSHKRKVKISGQIATVNYKFRKN